MNQPAEAPTSPGKPAIAILGVPFDNVTTAQALALIGKMIASRQPHYLATANVDFLVQAREDVELRRILFNAHLVLCDGTPLVWASRLLGNPLAERVAGSDLVPILIRLAEEQNLRIFFLGGSPDSTAKALANLREKHPRLAVTAYSPPFSRLQEMDHDEIARRIKEASPDMLFVSFGCPKQEKWIAMHYQALGVPLSAGVGATIDFLAGEMKRAPVWMRKTGTEWIFRMLQEPRRLFRRYVRGLWVFGWCILVQWWEFQLKRRRTKTGPPIAETADRQIEWQSVTVPEHLDLETVRSGVLDADRIAADGRHCLLRMEGVQFVDSTGVGFLIRLQKRMRAAGRQLILLHNGGTVERALKLMHLRDFFALAENMEAAENLLRIRLKEGGGPAQTAIPGLPLRLIWQGELIAENSAEIWEPAAKQFASEPPPSRFIIEMSDVRFIDSTGLGLMIRAKKAARLRNLPLEFSGVQPAVLNVVRMARLEDFLLRQPA